VRFGEVVTVVADPAASPGQQRKPDDPLFIAADNCQLDEQLPRLPVEPRPVKPAQPPTGLDPEPSAQGGALLSGQS
jgi:hypothetical protein